MLTDRRAPPTTSRLQSVPNNDISHNKTDHTAKLRIELKSILLAKPLKSGTFHFVIQFLLFHTDIEGKCECVSGLLGVGGKGAKDMLAPFQNYWGDLAPLPRCYATLMLILSFKEELDISSLNGHAEMTTNTVIRLWMHRLARTCAFGGDLRVR